MNNESFNTCRQCGNPRPAGRTLCPPCHNAHRNAVRHANLDAINEKRTAAERIKRAQRREENRCTVCAAPLDAETDAHRLTCARCSERQKAHTDRHHRKQRAAKSPTGNSTPLHVGRHVKADIVRYVTVKADRETLTAMQTLKYRERERRRAECDAEGITDHRERAKRMNVAFQTARLLRYVIKCYNRDYNFLPHYPRSRPYRGKFSVTYHFGADELTLDIIQHYATERNGSLSRTVCDLICAACFPPETVDAPQGQCEKIGTNSAGEHDPMTNNKIIITHLTQSL